MSAEPFGSRRRAISGSTFWRVKRMWAVVVLLAACGSGKSAQLGAATTGPPTTTTVASTTTSTTTTTLAPTTTERAATVQQYASLIAQNETNLRKYVAQASPCFSGPCSTAAAITVTTLAFTNESFILDLEAAVKVGGPRYIGAPPQEIAALYLATAKAALAVRAATLSTSCDTKGCPNGAAARSATSDLIRQLDGWKPYI